MAGYTNNAPYRPARSDMSLNSMEADPDFWELSPARKSPVLEGNAVDAEPGETALVPWDKKYTLAVSACCDIRVPDRL